MTYQRNETPEPLSENDPVSKWIQARAADLVDAAVAHGRVLTIHLQPREPLAMLNYDHVVTVRKAFKR